MEKIVKICGWDVGIKHLAYCKIIINPNNNQIDIEKWDNIDLTDSEKNKKYCQGVLKNKTKCECEAKFFCNSNSELKYFCKKHTGQFYDQNLLDKKYIDDHLVKKNLGSDCSCEFSSNNKKCEKKANYLFNNNPYCNIHKNSMIKKYQNENSVKVIKKEKNLASDPQRLCKKIYEKLQEIDFQDVQGVYIENQPSMLNPIMKSVSTFIFSYFIYLFQHLNKDDYKVKFVSPGVKIKFNLELIEFIEKKIKDHEKTDDCKCDLCILEKELKDNKEKFKEEYPKYKFSYDSTKALGIIYCENILINHNIPEKFNLIKDFKKKDDLCDAFLHGYKQLDTISLQ